MNPTTKHLSEVDNTFIDEENNTLYIDGFFADNCGDCEEGTSIAVVCLDTGKIIYRDNRFRGNQMVVEAINEALEANKVMLTKKYINILEAGNREAPNIGTIAVNGNMGVNFRKAVESHFDAEMLGYSFAGEDIERLDDCINASPIDLTVRLDGLGDGIAECRIELSETWVYS